MDLVFHSCSMETELILFSEREIQIRSNMNGLCRSLFCYKLGCISVAQIQPTLKFGPLLRNSPQVLILTVKLVQDQSLTNLNRHDSHKKKKKLNLNRHQIQISHNHKVLYSSSHHKDTVQILMDFLIKWENLNSYH